MNDKGAMISCVCKKPKKWIFQGVTCFDFTVLWIWIDEMTYVTGLHVKIYLFLERWENFSKPGLKHQANITRFHKNVLLSTGSWDGRIAISAHQIFLDPQLCHLRSASILEAHFTATHLKLRWPIASYQWGMNEFWFQPSMRNIGLSMEN